MTMENSFQEKMTSKTDSELFNYVRDKDLFQEEIVIYAIDELENRGKSNLEIAEIKVEILDRIKKQHEQIQRLRTEFDKIPKLISNAAKLIYLSLGIGLINTVIMETITGIQNFSDPKNLATGIITIAFIGFLGFKIQMGKKWARTTFLVFFILGLIFYPSILIQFFNINPLIGILSILETVLQICAIILLFRKESREWYDKISNIKIND